MADYFGESIHDFQKVLNGYRGKLTELHQEQPATAWAHNPIVYCKIDFTDPERFKKFVCDVSEMKPRLQSERDLHNEYPSLKAAYDHYQTLLKLYGG